MELPPWLWLLHLIIAIHLLIVLVVPLASTLTTWKFVRSPEDEQQDDDGYCHGSHDTCGVSDTAHDTAKTNWRGEILQGARTTHPVLNTSGDPRCYPRPDAGLEPAACTRREYVGRERDVPPIAALLRVTPAIVVPSPSTAAMLLASGWADIMYVVSTLAQDPAVRADGEI